jgi:hypothetical protein
VPGGGDGQGGPGRQLYYRSDVCRVPGLRIFSCESDILPKASYQCLGFKIQAFSESEYGLYAVSGFRLYADSVSRLIQI